SKELLPAGINNSFANEFHFPASINFNFSSAFRNVAGCYSASRPADLNGGGRFGNAEHFDGAVLRPITAAAMYFSDRPRSLPQDQSQLRSHPSWVARQPLQPHPQPRLASHVVIQLRLRSVLRHHQIHPPVPVIITQRRPTLFSIHLHPALLPSHRPQIASAVPFQPQASSRITPRTLRVHRKKILAQKHVLLPVPVVIPHAHREGRRQLRLQRQRPPFKVIAPVQENHRLQGVHFHYPHRFQFVAVNLLHARPTIGGIARVFLFHPRQRRSHRPQSTLRHFLLHRLIIVGLDHVHRPVAGQVPVVNLPRMFPARAILAVQSPVARHNIHSPVAVEVPHVHPVPPARVTAQSPSLGHFFQLPSLIVEHFDRSPFAGQHQVGFPVAVQIAEDRPADQARLLQA